MCGKALPFRKRVYSYSSECEAKARTTGLSPRRKQRSSEGKAKPYAHQTAELRRRFLQSHMPDENKEDTNRKAGIAYAAAFSLFGAVVAGLLVGWLLDRWLGTKPWLLVAGVTLGSIAGFYELIRAASRLS